MYNFDGRDKNEPCWYIINFCAFKYVEIPAAESYKVQEHKLHRAPISYDIEL